MQRKYLIGGAVTVHLAVTSDIPLPVCETLRGSFTSLHRSSKMAHTVLVARARAFSQELSIFGRTFKVTSSSLISGSTTPDEDLHRSEGWQETDRNDDRLIGTDDSFKSRKMWSSWGTESSRVCYSRSLSIAFIANFDMINRYWTTQTRRRDRSSQTYDYSLYLRVSILSGSPLIHDTFTLLR